ncbi:hypothetical protein [Roseomonas sp. USHLN139]
MTDPLASPVSVVRAAATARGLVALGRFHPIDRPLTGESRA